jgi:hypothetical protein
MRRLKVNLKTKLVDLDAVASVLLLPAKRRE